MASGVDDQPLLDDDVGEDSDPVEQQPTGAPIARQVFSFDDVVSGIFLVSFDTHKGNIVEWKMPETLDVSGLEFKAIASGFHLLEDDYVLFNLHGMYGLSCCRKLSVDSEEERGARMRSVGVLCPSFYALGRHQEFLKRQALSFAEDPTSGYTQLERYFTSHQPSGESYAVQSPLPATAAVTPGQSVVPRQQVLHPPGCVSEFCYSFGAKMFALWRLVLLRKRILFVGHPPVGLLCGRVYSTHMMSSASVRLSSAKDTNGLFYVNVNDISDLTREKSYIACTTETIFETKTHLFDVMVKDNDITIVDSSNDEHLDSIVHVSRADEQRLADLNIKRSQLSAESEAGEEELFMNFFQDMNNRLVGLLRRLSSSPELRLTMADVEGIGLDAYDIGFVRQFGQVHGVRVLSESSWCPWLHCI